MTVEELNKVDIIAVRPGSPIVKLVIADHLSWDDPHGHAMLIQDKINSYLEFVASGELQRTAEPKIPEPCEVWITLAAKHRPPPEAQQVLFRMKDFLRGVGIEFEIDLRDEN